MIYCETPDLETWVAPPQEDFPRPTWTKLSANGVLLSNSLEYANWHSTPVEPIVCESCWNPGCSQAGLARLVRLDGHILWLAARPDDVFGSYVDTLTRDNLLAAPVLMPIPTWEQLRARVPSLPDPEYFPRATRIDIADLWMYEMPRRARACAVQQISTSLKAAVASDPLDLDPARDVVALMVNWVLDDPQKAVDGSVQRIISSSSSVNTFYFEDEEWPCFFAEIENSFVWGADWGYIDNIRRSQNPECRS